MPRVITIRILDGGGDNPIPSPAPQPSETSPNPETKQTKEQKTMGQLLRTYIGRRVFNIVKSQATQFAGKYFDASEAYMMQSGVSNAVDTIEGLINMTTTGIMAGKAFSLAGFSSTLGFGVGIASALISKTAQAVGAYADASRGLIENAYSNYFYGARAGFQTGGHGTEN